MGVPVVTLAGQRLITRQGLGILRVCGLDEFIAEDVNDYIELAVNFAANRELLGQLRGELRNRVLNSPLFDTDAFSKKFHSALRALWREWCEE